MSAFKTVRFKEYVVPEVLRYIEEGRRAALVTLVDIVGSSPRPLGSQMAVSENGDALGNITGGCAEAAIVAEAINAIQAGENRRLRFGKGSPFIDVKLACGAGIEVFINVDLKRDMVAELVGDVADRRAVTLSQDTKTGETSVAAPATDDDTPSFGAQTVYQKRFEPATRVFAIGKGPILVSLARFGKLLDFETHAMSSEESTLLQVEPEVATVTHLTVPSAFVCPAFDAHTAVVLLFHEHDWEPPIIQQALATDAFYVGVLGSRNTHNARIELLKELGCDEAAIQRIKAPVGLEIGAKSPHEIALAIAGEIVKTKREQMVR